MPRPPPGDAFSKVRLQAGDDAGAVAWKVASSQLELYASHADFIEKVARQHGATW